MKLSTAQSALVFEQFTEKMSVLEEDEQLLRGAYMLGAAMMAGMAGDDPAAQAQACDAAVGDCVRELSEDGMGFDESDEACFTEEEQRQCDATVAEVNPCFDAMIEWAFVIFPRPGLQYL